MKVIEYGMVFGGGTNKCSVILLNQTLHGVIIYLLKGFCIGINFN